MASRHAFPRRLTRDHTSVLSGLYAGLSRPSSLATATSSADSGVGSSPRSTLVCSNCCGSSRIKPPPLEERRCWTLSDVFHLNGFHCPDGLLGLLVIDTSTTGCEASDLRCARCLKPPQPRFVAFELVSRLPPIMVSPPPLERCKTLKQNQLFKQCPDIGPRCRRRRKDIGAIRRGVPRVRRGLL